MKIPSTRFSTAANEFISDMTQGLVPHPIPSTKVNTMFDGLAGARFSARDNSRGH